MKILLIGPPGVGKGTQSKLICDFYNIEHISTGDILRKHIRDYTNIGKMINEIDINNGKLVRDDLINDLIKYICNNNLIKSYLLDGYPRTLNQAIFYVNRVLNKFNKYIVIYLNANREYILNRISQRRICLNCGGIYNLKENYSQDSDLCSVCGNKLIQRLDDRYEVFQERLKIYDETTFDIINYFSDLNVLFEVDGSGEIDYVFNNIRNVIGEYYDLY